VSSATLSGVTLTWEASADADLIAYRVYRLDEPNTLLVAEVPAETTTYTDAAVQENATYVYAVSALDRALNESEQALAEAVTVERLKVQVTFTATVPAATNSSVYIAGNFGAGFPAWDPAGMVMTQLDDTHWTITLELVEGTAVEYKYVRGDWSAVEKGANCDEIANRRLTVTPGENATQSVEDQVEKWRDLDNCG
jgi:hypothetical protein